MCFLIHEWICDLTILRRRQSVVALDATSHEMKALCVLALAVVLPCAVLAKGYRNGYTGVDLASLPESELSHNHKPATRLNLNVLPKVSALLTVRLPPHAGTALHKCVL